MVFLARDHEQEELLTSSDVMRLLTWSGSGILTDPSRALITGRMLSAGDLRFPSRRVKWRYLFTGRRMEYSRSLLKDRLMIL